MPAPKSGTVHLIGAGLTGSLLAIMLARRGHAVEIHERRADLRRERVAAGRSINLALSVRGLEALHRVGLEREVLAMAIPMRGRLMHSVQGELTFQRYGKDDSEFINSISRAGLNQVLMTKAEEAGARIHFNQRLTGADFSIPNEVRLRFRDERTGDDIVREAERVIGTDGSASELRREILRAGGQRCTEEQLDYGYKELTIAGTPDGTHRMERHALHIWPRGSFMLIALPNLDGSFTCTLFIPWKGENSFETLTTSESVRGFFSRHFPDALSLVSGLEETFFSNPTGHMVTIKTYPWSHGDRAFLVGDAAHAIVPFFGQGMNCGFEDCSRLDDLLGHGWDWERTISEFENSRKPNTDAIADMAVENFIEMRDKVADPRFLLAKEVEKRLQKEFPGQYVPRYGLVTFSTTPYLLAYEIGKVQAEILAELCSGVDRAEEVDLTRAGELIRTRLGGLMEKRARSDSWT
jgi:kynurenine 3-monooxygenase